MTDKYLKRVNYFTGEALLTDDFQTEQDYFLTTGQYHNSHMHTWGIAYGLEVKQTGQVVTVSKGMAVDCQGREIILLQDQQLTIPDINKQYYLTIAYNAVLTDYTEDTGVKGFKRYSEIPQFAFSDSVVDPSLTILLSIIPPSGNNTVSALENNDGKNQRHYCGIKVGDVEFHSDQTPPPSISIQDNNNLSINTNTDFEQDITVTGEVSAGSLLINSTHHEGLGTISSKDCIVTFDTNIIDPKIKVGYVLISTQVPGGRKQMREISAINDNTLTVKAAFNPPLQKSSYLYTTTEVLSISTVLSGNTDPQNLLMIGDDGSVQFGDVDSTTLPINMTVAGGIKTTGNIQAANFIGNGSGLKNLASVWTQNSADNSIYYNNGNVGIGVQNPTALFQVQGSGTSGTGTLSCNLSFDKSDPTKVYTVYGNNTDFENQLNQGDMVIIGSTTLADQTVALDLPVVFSVDKVNSTDDTKPPSFNINLSNSNIPSDFNDVLKLVDSTFNIVPSNLGTFGTATQPNILAISPNGSVNTSGVNNINSDKIIIDKNYSYTQSSGNLNCIGINVVGGVPQNTNNPPQTSGSINCGVLNVGPYCNNKNSNSGTISENAPPSSDLTKGHAVAVFYGDIYVYGNVYNYRNMNSPWSAPNKAQINNPSLEQANNFDLDIVNIIETWGEGEKTTSGIVPADGTLVGTIIPDNEDGCMNLACTVNGQEKPRYINCFAGKVNMNFFANNSFSMPIKKMESWSVVSRTSPDCSYRYCIYFIPFI